MPQECIFSSPSLLLLVAQLFIMFVYVGLKEGCPMSLYLFYLFIGVVVKELNECIVGKGAALKII